MKVFFKAQTTCKFIDVYMHFRPVDALRVEEKGKSTLQSVQLSDSEIKLERLMAVSSWPATQDTVSLPLETPATQDTLSSFPLETRANYATLSLPIETPLTHSALSQPLENAGYPFAPA